MSAVPILCLTVAASTITPVDATTSSRPRKPDEGRITQVVKYCASSPEGCSFVIDPARSREYTTAVKSLGNAVINCTISDMTVNRKVDLRTGSTDNIGGEITGSVSTEGSISGTAEVSKDATSESHQNHKTPNLKEGPTSEFGAKSSVREGAKASGTQAAKLAFQTAFKAHYARSWQTEHTESTTYNTTVKSHDMLVFGASAAMQRVVGDIVTENGKKLSGVRVDTPSTINTSSFIAQTYSVPEGMCGNLRPQGNTAGGGSPTPKTSDNQPGGHADAILRPGPTHGNDPTPNPG
ncbi:hypothetical protein [Streptomyces niger]|uniref:hypothetical protein n=1 Tax=Streptomyces niger TaxID=66373 RepID=UPI0018FE530C|nr:hypothetical protein [Streptomyces niger]